MNPDDDNDIDISGTISTIGQTVANVITAAKGAETAAKDAYNGAKTVQDNAKSTSISPTAVAVLIALGLLTVIVVTRKKSA